jgi:hypothetical protein
MAIDFSKGIDYSPLTRMIDLEFQNNVKGVFTPEELKQIGEEAEGKGIKPEDGLPFLEEKYHAKTGRYFMEEMRLLMNEYVHHAANIVAKSRRDAENFANSGEENVSQFDKLMNEKKYEEAAKFFDETLNEIEKQNTSS